MNDAAYNVGYLVGMAIRVSMERRAERRALQQHDAVNLTYCRQNAAGWISWGIPMSCGMYVARATVYCSAHHRYKPCNLLDK